MGGQGRQGRKDSKGGQEKGRGEERRGEGKTREKGRKGRKKILFPSLKGHSYFIWTEQAVQIKENTTYCCFSG